MPPLRHRPIDLLLGALIPLLLPFGIALELGLLLLAAMALWQCWRSRGQTRSGASRDLAVIFALLWLAGLLSAIDAFSSDRSLTWLLAAPGYALAALALAQIASDPARRPTLLLGAALPVALWTADAMLQATTGLSLGGAAVADRLSGVFGADDLKLGPVLALLSPFLLLAVMPGAAPDRARRWPFLLAFLALTAVIALAGARAAWIGFALVLIGLALHRHHRQPRRLLAGLGLVLLLTAGLATLAYLQSERFAARVDRTLAAFDGSRAGLDHALAGRLPIFDTALAMSQAHPLNGVGVRGFRHAYPAHAAADDPWVSADGSHGASHPHHWMLEVAAEQGLVGLLAWTGVLALLLRRWWRASSRDRANALAPALALLVLLWPLNTHPALYSSFWQALWWWSLGLYLGCLGERKTAPA